MCVQTFSNRKPKPTGVGWKIFRHHPELGLMGFFFQGNREVGVWLQATRRSRDEYTTSDPRNLGFHIYKVKADAGEAMKIWSPVPLVLRKVRYRKAAGQRIGDGGWNNEARVVVAAEIKILK